MFCIIYYILNNKWQKIINPHVQVFSRGLFMVHLVIETLAGLNLFASSLCLHLCFVLFCFTGLFVRKQWRRRFQLCRRRRKSWPRMCCQEQEARSPNFHWLISESSLVSEAGDGRRKNPTATIAHSCSVNLLGWMCLFNSFFVSCNYSSISSGLLCLFTQSAALNWFISTVFE